MKRIHFIIGLGFLAIIVVAVYYTTRTQSTPQNGIASSGGSDSLNVLIEEIPYWLQNDPQWSRETLGGSNESMAAAGCTITCVAMALSSLDVRITPLDLCRALKRRNGFTNRGHLIWEKIADVANSDITTDFPSLAHSSIDRALLAGRPVITKIMLGGRVPHWVLVVGKEGKEYLAIDPLNTDRLLVHLSDCSTTIYSIRVLRRA